MGWERLGCEYSSRQGCRMVTREAYYTTCLTPASRAMRSMFWACSTSPFLASGRLKPLKRRNNMSTPRNCCSSTSSLSQSTTMAHQCVCSLEASHRRGIGLSQTALEKADADVLQRPSCARVDIAGDGVDGPSNFPQLTAQGAS